MKEKIHTVHRKGRETYILYNCNRVTSELNSIDS